MIIFVSVKVIVKLNNNAPTRRTSLSASGKQHVDCQVSGEQGSYKPTGNYIVI